MIKKIQKDQNGIILVMTLIIMAIFLTVAVGFGVVIISDIKQAATIDNSMVAYFAADAGMERNLFIFRKSEKSSIEDIASSTLRLGNNSSWNISSSTDYEASFIRQRLKNGQGVNLYFLNRATGNNLSKSINVSWDKSLYSATKMQISFTRLKLEDGIYRTDSSGVFLSTTTNNCFDFLDKDESGNTSPSDYAVEIKALGSADGYIDKLRVTGYDDSCGTEDADKVDDAISNISLIVNGKFGNSTQKIVAHLPPRTPVSGIFGFVLFSEEDITKR